MYGTAVATLTQEFLTHILNDLQPANIRFINLCHFQPLWPHNLESLIHAPHAPTHSLLFYRVCGRIWILYQSTCQVLIREVLRLHKFPRMLTRLFKCFKGEYFTFFFLFGSQISMNSVIMKQIVSSSLI